MKNHLVKCLIAGMLFCVATSCLANQGIIVNGTPDAGMLDMTYRVAYGNYGQKPVFGAIKRLSVTHSIPVQLQMKRGYKYVGIVPITINGHNLNGNNKFMQPQQCYLITSKEGSKQSLAISTFVNADGHGRITCSPTV